MAITITKNKTMEPDVLRHPLMRNNVTRADLDVLISYLQGENPRLTQGSNVLRFEQEWSDWLGVKYSVYVNSGSSANLITLSVLKELYGGGEIIVPPLTWASDIFACLHNGYLPVFIDINPQTLALNLEKTLDKITDKTRAVFLTHVQGFNGLTENFLEELAERGVTLIEDVCESVGATFIGRKLGSFGLMSNFSFYYAHHVSTIEGGMVCTDNEEIYQMLRMFRSHGMVREATGGGIKEKLISENPSLNPEFIFAFPAYNVRNTEIGAVLGSNQLKRIDKNNEIRRSNHELFLENIDEKRFRTNFASKGSCSYAFNVILNEPEIKLRDRVEAVMISAGVEFRRGSSGGGNQLRQPYLREIIEERAWEDYPETEHVHFFGWYVGNYPDLGKEKILHLCEVLNNA